MDTQSKDYRIMHEISKCLMSIPAPDLIRISRFESPESDYYIQVNYEYYEDGSIKNAVPVILSKETK